MNTEALKREAESLAVPFLVVCCFGILLGATISQAQSYGKLCIQLCNETCGPKCLVNVGYASQYCQCVYVPDPDFINNSRIHYFNLSVTKS